MARTQEFAKSILSGIFPGKPLRLREGVHKQLKEREWIFNRAENGIIFLIHRNGVYGVGVRPEDIEWNEQ